MFDRIGTKRAKLLGIIDLTQGFYQIALSPEVRRAPAFITYNGVRQYTRLPFGIKGGPSWFQQHIAHTVLKDYLYDICELYIDDIIVTRDTEEEFIENVIKIFERYRQYNIKAKPSKVKLRLTSVDNVGRELSHDGTRMQDEKTRKALDFPLPEYVKQLSSFIGLAEYFIGQKNLYR